MNRIVAAVVAVLMIVGALVIRNRLDEEERRGPYKLVCATELAAACNSLEGAEVTIEPAGVTADRDDPGYEGWLTAGRWPTADDATIVGHTRVAVAIWRDRAAALRRRCGDVTAKCLGDAARDATWDKSRGSAAWGPVKIAFADPATSAGGLAALVAATAGFAGNVDLVPAALEVDDAYLGWLTALEGAHVAIDLASMLAQGPAAADAYIGLDSEIAPVFAQAARGNELEVVYLAAVDIEARLTTLSDRDPPTGIREALEANGWRPAAPQGGRSPSTSAFAGVRKLWRDSVR